MLWSCVKAMCACQWGESLHLRINYMCTALLFLDLSLDVGTHFTLDPPTLYSNIYYVLKA